MACPIISKSDIKQKVPKIIGNLSCEKCEIIEISNLKERITCNIKYCEECSKKLLIKNDSMFLCDPELKSQEVKIDDENEKSMNDCKICYPNITKVCNEICNKSNLGSHLNTNKFRTYTCPQCNRKDILLEDRKFHDSECEFQLVKCRDCENNCFRKDENKHREKECLAKRCSCINCKGSLKNEKEILELHQGECLQGCIKCKECGIPLKPNHRCSEINFLKSINNKLSHLSQCLRALSECKPDLIEYIYSSVEKNYKIFSRVL